MKRFLPVLLCLSPFAALAQDDMVGTWKISCEDGPCQAFFAVQKEGQELLAWSLLHDKQAGHDVAVLRLPVGAALPPGVRITVGTAQAQLPFQFCDPNSCTAIAVLDAPMKAALGSAEKAQVAWYVYGQPQATAVEVPVNGFSDAMARLAAR